MTIQLRPYQTGAIDAFIAAAKPGATKMIVLPTGTGKTFTALALAKKMNARTLWIAHREELISQPLKALNAVWPEKRGGVVKAGRNEWMRDVVFASIQTICRPKRLADIQKIPFDLIVIDEAHHSLAKSYRDVLTALGCGADGPPLLGLTATPERMDNKALDEVFGGICYQLHLKQAIQAGYLCGVEIKQRPIDVNLDEVGKVAGDFNAGQLDLALVNAGIVDEVVKAYIEHATDKKTIIFTISVKQAEAIAEKLDSLGHSATSVSGYLDTDLRRQRLNDFGKGKYKVIVNCMVLTEGYDEPAVDCIIMARPTQSKSLYIQCIGRGLRLFPMKTECLIVDMVGMSTRHTLVQAPVIFGLESEEKAERERRESIEMTEDELAEFWRKKFETQSCGLKPITGSALRWIQDDGVFLLGVGQFGTIRLTGDSAADEWQVEVVGNRMGSQSNIFLTQDPVDLQFAQGISEDYVRRCGQTRISEGQWNTEKKVTPAQAAALKRFGIDAPKELSRGDASNMLTAAIAKRAVAPATGKQTGFLRRMGIPFKEGISKSEAGRLIGKAKAGGGV